MHSSYGSFQRRVAQLTLPVLALAVVLSYAVRDAAAGAGTAPPAPPPAPGQVTGNDQIGLSSSYMIRWAAPASCVEGEAVVYELLIDGEQRSTIESTSCEGSFTTIGFVEAVVLYRVRYRRAAESTAQLLPGSHRIQIGAGNARILSFAAVGYVPGEIDVRDRDVLTFDVRTSGFDRCEIRTLGAGELRGGVAPRPAPVNGQVRSPMLLLSKGPLYSFLLTCYANGIAGRDSGLSATVDFRHRGFNDAYVATVGDLNADGLRDIYVREPSCQVEGSCDRLEPVKRFALLQGPGRTFQILRYIYLEPAERAAADALPTTGPLRLVAADINLDGSNDLVIKNVAAAIPGVADLIVYAAMDPDGELPPLAVRPIDGRLAGFYAQIDAWHRDRSFFEDNAPLRIVGAEPPSRRWVGAANPTNYFLINLFIARCQNDTGLPCASSRVDPPQCVVFTPVYDDFGNLIGNRTTNVCVNDFIHIYAYQPGSVTFDRDFSVFNQDALAMTGPLEQAMGEGLLRSRSGIAVLIERILERVLGVDVMGQVLGQDGSLDSDFDLPDALLRIRRLGEIFDNIHRGVEVITEDDDEERRRQEAIADVGELIRTGAIDTSREFDSELDAARSVLDVIAPVTREHDIEIGGEVYSVEVDGNKRYRYTVPVVRRSNQIPPEIVDVPLDTIPAGADHEADYHTHPSVARHSGGDRDRAIKLESRSYVRGAIDTVCYDGVTNTVCGVEFTAIGESRYGIPRCK